MGLNINSLSFSFVSNIAGASGGALGAQQNLIVSHSNFSKNVATAKGGAIYAISSLVEINSAIIVNNEGSFGGGINLEYSNRIFTDFTMFIVSFDNTQLKLQIVMCQET